MFVPTVTHPIGDFVRDWVPKLSAYLPEQLQSQTLDSIAAFLINALLCVIAVCAVNIGSAPILIYMERKVCAHVQCRLGPMRLGWHGTLQTIADVIKMLFKEVYSPSGADKLMFYVAPMIVLIAPFIIAAHSVRPQPDCRRHRYGHPDDYRSKRLWRVGHFAWRLEQQQQVFPARCTP